MIICTSESVIAYRQTDDETLYLLFALPAIADCGMG